ncbi:hypothetical protein SAMN05216388_10882 [Halorientalis persicus]|uniref:Uncharacterized protein n=1 Tax=Halorientalis persicus TaxID=1367881 RepID=A0A1H8WZH9_9EURY|nr:hypothetical protein [Halorientalis persicus]SEP32518.1 hypothetical protein SAMN05216388_10882 [Halorientalis persicus]
MRAARKTPFGEVPDLYDGIAGLAALLVLAWAILYAMQPVLGVLVALTILSVYAVARTGDYEHTTVVAGLWLLVFASLFSLGFPGVFLGGILALIAYGLYRTL